MNKNHRLIIFSFYLIFTVSSLVITEKNQDVMGFGPDDPECYEQGNCDFFTEPFDAMVTPFQTVFGDFTFIIFWGIIMGILWFRVGNTMLVAVVGVTLSVLFLEGFSEDAKTIGYALVAVAIGIALYQLFTVRTHFPTN